MIRPMRWWDIPAVAQLEAASYPHDPWSAESFWGELASGGRYFVCEDSEIVGYAGLSISFDEGNVQTVAVAPAARGRGNGLALLDELFGAADGLHRLDLEVASRNEVALALYAKRGFVEVGRRKGYYAAENDDAILMSVTL